MTRILVPLDGSRLAEKALCCAIALATQLPAERVLFRAISIPSDVRKALDRAGLESDVLLENLEIEANEYLMSIVQRLLPNAGLDLCPIVQRGPPARVRVGGSSSGTRGKSPVGQGMGLSVSVSVPVPVSALASVSDAISASSSATFSAREEPPELFSGGCDSHVQPAARQTAETSAVQIANSVFLFTGASLGIGQMDYDPINLKQYKAGIYNV